MDVKAKVTLVGATGVVGREILGALWEEEFPDDQLTLLGSERSAGGEVDYGEDTLPVEPITADSFRGQNVVILATPKEVSKTLAPKAQAQGAWVVDVSDAFRSDPSVPLYLPGVNDRVLSSDFHGRIVSVPSAIPTAMALLLEPLASFGISRVHLTALMGASSAGQAGISELERQTADLLSGREPEPGLFPHRLALNFMPQVGNFVGPDSEEELRWGQEWSKLHPDRRLSVSGTAIQVPTFFGHALSLLVEANGPLSVERVRQAMKEGKGLKVLDQPEERIYPMPMLVTADDTVHVGRIRTVPSRPNELQLFAAVDNAGRGAAWTAVEAALALAQKR